MGDEPVVDPVEEVVGPLVVVAIEVLVLLGGVVVELLVLVEDGVEELVVVLSAMVAVVDDAVVAVVVGASVVDGSWSAVVLVVSFTPPGVPSRFSSVPIDGSPPNSGGAGTMRPRLSREVGASMSRRNEVGESGSFSEKPTAGMPAAGAGPSTRTLTAFTASGAATAAAVTVESDNASRNRPRPAGFLGCSKYICNPT